MSRCEVYRMECHAESTLGDIELDTIVKPHNPHFRDSIVPLDPKKDSIAKYCITRTSTMLGNLRSQKRVRITAIICEFVLDLHGSTYCTSVLGVAKPDVKPFFYDIKRLKINDMPLVRISVPTKKPQSPTFRKRNMLSSQEVSKQNSRVTVSSANEAEMAETEDIPLIDLREVQADAKDVSGIKLPLHELLTKNGEKLHAEGKYLEAIKTMEEAEKAFLTEMAKQNRLKSDKGEVALPNAQCFRCGDMVRVDLDKPGYSHYEWKAREAEASRKSGRRAEEKTTARVLGGLAGVIEQRLDKIESAHYAMTPREPLPHDDRKAFPQTICSLCLGDAEKDIRNRPLVQRIRQLRSTKF
mmetsp:Transcript_12753/g.44673  ORF Transcript_12753/g.44673 Transcript_12753/m.44673 type:complete len:355 (+) Transcript_12753:641-1705(+)